jgi:hypothetical protein
MMKLKKYSQALTAACVCTLAGGMISAPTQAAMEMEPSFYAGAAYGFGRVNNSDFEDDNGVYKIFIAGKFNPYVGIEAAYNDYGDSENAGNTAELTGNTLALVGFLPINERFDVFLKGGQLWWRDKVTVLDTYSDTLTGDEYFYGVGANFHITEMIALRLEMERYKVELSSDEVGVDIDGSSDIDVASFGVSMNF